MRFKHRCTISLTVAGLSLLLCCLGVNVLQAQDWKPGNARVQAITGSATYSKAGQQPAPLKVGTEVDSGTTIKTTRNSTVDLFFGKLIGVLRIMPSTTLSMDKLAAAFTGTDSLVEVQLNLPEGTMMFNVNKLTAGSKYEIKIPNGVAGIRGTSGRISSAANIFLKDGTFVLAYVPPNAPPRTYTLTAPPPKVFSPATGVQEAAPEITRRFDTDKKVMDEAARGPQPSGPTGTGAPGAGQPGTGQQPGAGTGGESPAPVNPPISPVTP
jgi:hypothetical protein